MSRFFTIDSIEIEGFRGYLKPIEHHLGGKSALIYGPQGSGKSSTLNAIEWVLFGKIAYFKSAESKSDIELINSRMTGLECRVTMVMRDGASAIEITRRKKSSGRETQLTVYTDKGEMTGNDAQEFLFRELGLTLDDFYRSVYLHQESVRALITEDPRDRDEAIDRLLGLGEARDIIGSMPMSEIKDVIDELKAQREKIISKLEGAIEQIKHEVKKAENDARREGFQDDQFNESQVGYMLDNLRPKIENISKDFTVVCPELESDITTGSVLRSIAKLKMFVRDCRKRIIEITGIENLTAEQSELTQISKELRMIMEEIQKVRSEIDSIKGTHGDFSEIDNHKKSVEHRLNDLKNSRETLDANARLAKEALLFFNDPNLSFCPVCGQPINRGEIKKHLEEVVGSITGGRINEIDEKIKMAKEEKENLNGIIDRLQKLEKKKDELNQDLEKLNHRIEKITHVEVKIDEMKDFVDKQILDLNQKIEESSKIYEKRNKDIEDLDQFVDRIKAVNNVLLKREEYEILEKRSKAEYDKRTEYSKTIEEAEKFKGRLETIAQIISEVQTSLAAQSLSAIQEEVSNFYSRLRSHPYYNTLEISVNSKNVSGVQKNTYLIRAFSAEESRGTHVSSRFSTGQMNCAALSIFLSLAKLSKSSLGFILLDDPSQSLDLEHLNGLVDVLTDISKERQIVIATQDERLYGEVNKKFHSYDNSVLIKFKPWTKDGCAVEN